MTPQSRQVLAACKGLVLLWGLLVVLLAATIAVAFSGIDPSAQTAVNLAIAAIQVVIIVVFFMNLRTSTTLLRLTAVAGVYWLFIMFVLTFNDYQSRPPSSPCGEPAFAGSTTSQCPTSVK